MQSIVTLFTAVNHCSGPRRKQNVWLNRVKRSCSCVVIGGFRSSLSVSVFSGQLLVAVIMIDGSKIRKSLAGVEVQSPYVIERRSNGVAGIGGTHVNALLTLINLPSYAAG